MKKAASICVLALLLLVNSCETDLDVAPYKPISIVYGLINIKDTTQYVRINRGFSTTGDPYDIVQINDSVNYPQDLFEVFLEEYRNGELVGDPVPYQAVDRQKEPGLFSNESNCVFRTSTPIQKDCTYKLRVIEKETGREIYGEAGILGNVTMEEAFLWERAYYRVDYYAEPLPEYEGSLDPYDHTHYIVRFLYWEYVNGETYHKYVDWVPTMDPLKDIADDDTSFQMSDKYFEYLSTQIPVDPNVKRQARGVDYMLALPGMELQNFIQVYEQPTNPHFLPEYSNMHNGRGVFGSKYFYTYFGLKLRKRTVDTISWGQHLYHHRFRDSNGNWH
jgi:hypothetical protein